MQVSNRTTFNLKVLLSAEKDYFNRKQTAKSITVSPDQLRHSQPLVNTAKNFRPFSSPSD